MVSQSTAARQSVDPLTLLSAFPSEFSRDNFGKNLTVQKLAGDASTREYYRVACENPNKSFILQCADTFVGVSDDRHPFIAGRNLLARAGIPVPKIIAKKPELGWLLQQDLGDETLQTSGRKDLYSVAIDYSLLMAKNIRPANETLGQLAHEAPHFSWAFDFEKLNWEMNFTAEHLVGKILKQDRDAFLTATQFNTRYLDARPRFFAHRDYHSRNLMLFNSTLYAIDFQDGRMGPITYDAVSLIWDPYVRLSEDEQSKLWSRFVEGCRSITTEALQEECYRMIIQRMLKAAGSYASFYNNRGRTSYLPSVEPAIESVMWALRKLQSEGFSKPEDAQLLTLVSRIQEQVPAILKIT